MEPKMLRLLISLFLHSPVSLFFFSVFLIHSPQSTVFCDQPLIHTSLPGFSDPLPFHLETGYVEVGESNQDLLFYYFVQSEANPRDDPLVLWLNGGPGCSAWSGLVFEVGPLRYEMAEYDGSLPTLKLNPYSWTKVANIIFVDAPVGAGFSYSRVSKDDGVGDIKSCQEINQFLRKWLNDHPQFLKNQLYIGGDSYSGKIIPPVVQNIASSKEAGQDPFLNIKGYFIGNPLTDLQFDENGKVPYLHGMGIISDELYQSAEKHCKGNYASPSNKECQKDLHEVNKCTLGINIGHILEPSCDYDSPKPEESNGNRRSLEDSLKTSSQLSFHPKCRAYWYQLSYFWANDEKVREALGIHKGSKKEWLRCNRDLNYTHDIVSTVLYHRNLTSRGYRALIYSGDHDADVPFVGTLEWIRSLNYPIVENWRSWFVDSQIAGYTRTYANNLTFATIKGGGHTAPEYKPKEGLAMFQRWISEKPL